MARSEAPMDRQERADRAEQADRADDVRAVAGVAATIAATLTATAGRWPSPPQHPTDRTGLRVLTTPDYDVWLLRWPQGSSVEPHDHGESMGAFSVVQGELLELRWRDGERVTRRIGPGGTVGIARGAVHDVVGASDGALSVHVYSPPLVSMRFYDADGSRVVRTERVDGEEPDARPGDPAGVPPDLAGVTSLV